MLECEYNPLKEKIIVICLQQKKHTNFHPLLSLKEAEKPYCERLHRIKDLMQRSKVSIEEVISELGQYLFVTIPS